jgi:hypothetical protein
VRLTLTIEGDPLLSADLLGRPKRMTAGETTATTPGGAVVRWHGQRGTRAFDAPAIITLALELTREVAIALLSSWLYDKLKGGRARRLIVDRVEVQITEGEIRRVLLERMESQEQ